MNLTHWIFKQRNKGLTDEEIEAKREVRRSKVRDRRRRAKSMAKTYTKEKLVKRRDDLYEVSKPAYNTYHNAKNPKSEKKAKVKVEVLEIGIRQHRSAITQSNMNDMKKEPEVIILEKKIKKKKKRLWRL